MLVFRPVHLDGRAVHDVFAATSAFSLRSSRTGSFGEIPSTFPARQSRLAHGYMYFRVYSSRADTQTGLPKHFNLLIDPASHGPILRR